MFMQAFPQDESTFLLPGPVGEIEILATPVQNNTTNDTVIICHPHPLFGGTMHNKVVTTLAKVFYNLSLDTIRFNFRGVGKSQGTHDEGKGELQDLLTIADWLTTLRPQGKIWLAGFSFGAYVAAQGAMQIAAKALVTIAPMVSRFKQNSQPVIINCPWILVQGEQDEVIPPQEVFDWIETLTPKPILIKLPGAGHFFHGQLLELRTKLEQNLLAFKGE